MSTNFSDGSYSCTPGIALLAKVLAGRCEMHYTRAAVGSGTLAAGESPKTMTEPAGYVMDAMIAGVSNPVDGECQVTVQLSGANVDTGFYVTGVMLYAQDPDDGEIPYTYLVLETEPEWIRPKSAEVGKLATFDLIAAVGAVDHVTATIDPNANTIRETDISIATDSWSASDDMDFPYQADITANVTADSVAEIVLSRASQVPASKAGVCPTIETASGYVRVYAKKTPESALTGVLRWRD